MRSPCCRRVRAGATVPKPRPRPESVRAVHRADRRRPRPPRRLSRVAASCAPAAAATCCSRPRAPAARFRAVPERYPSFPDFRLSPRPVGCAADPGERRLLLRQLVARPGRRVLPEPGRAHRVAAAARRVGRRSSPTTPSSPTWRPTSRRCWSASTDRPARPSASSCRSTLCYELVGQLRRLWKGFDGGREAHDALDAFFADVRRACQRDATLVVRGRRRAGRAVRRRSRRWCSGSRITEPSARRCTPSPCAARSASSRSAGATTADEEERSSSCSAPGTAGARRCVRSCGPMSPPRSRASTAPTEIDLAVPCTYDIEVAGTKYLHALADDGDVPLVLLFSGTTFSARRDGLQRRAGAWHEEASYRLPVRVWRDVMDLYFPNSGLGAPSSRRDPRRPRRASRPSGRCRRGTRRSSVLLKEAGDDDP